MNGLPDVLQIEITNACNLRCEMCLHSQWPKDYKEQITVDTFKSLAEEVFPHLKKLVLYGWGEPFMHPQFIELLRISRKWLPPESKILVTTNGLLLNKELIKTINEQKLIDELVISCDLMTSSSSNISQESNTLFIGHTAANKVYENIKSITSLPNRSIRLGIETLVMRSNYKNLPSLIKECGNIGVDFIVVSHVYPFFPQLEHESLYSLISSEALPALEELGGKGWELILKITREQLGLAFHIQNANKPATAQYMSILTKTKERNVLPNIPLYMQIKDKLPLFNDVIKIFHQCNALADEMNLELDLPPVFPIYSNRKCPYVEKNATVIRADGNVAPCFKDMYDHRSYLSFHQRPFSAYSYGNINERTLKEIWQSEEYVKFRERMRNMNENFQYCGDCPISSNNCYYAIEDETDCYGNLPFCAECPYSLDLTRCLL